MTLRDLTYSDQVHLWLGDVTQVLSGGRSLRNSWGGDRWGSGQADGCDLGGGFDGIGRGHRLCGGGGSGGWSLCRLLYDHWRPLWSLRASGWCL